MNDNFKRPRIVEIKRKPKVAEVKENAKSPEEDADEFSNLVNTLPTGPADHAREALRDKQLEDIAPVNPEEELKKKRKRFGLF